MAQNTSSAVMQQRADHSDKLNYFPTPPWATRALVRWIEEHIAPVQDLDCWEPACGQGHMARPLAESFREVFASDIVDRGYGHQHDFLFPGDDSRFDWVITNPPFSMAEEFVITGLRHAKVGVAMLVRSAFLEAEGRFLKLFQPYPPRAALQFVERVPMFKGQVRNPAELYWDEEAKKNRRPSSATAYCWVVWVHGYVGKPELAWIPPSRRKLERQGDYEAVS